MSQKKTIFFITINHRIKGLSKSTTA